MPTLMSDFITAQVASCSLQPAVSARHWENGRPQRKPGHRRSDIALITAPPSQYKTILPDGSLYDENA